MQLIPQATQNAAAIDLINREMVGFIRRQLATSYDLVMHDPQAVLTAMGGNAVSALTRYAAMHAALAAIGEDGGIVAPNFAVFTPQEDGTVIYAAPPEL